jgi:Radical SAM superfamily
VERAAIVQLPFPSTAAGDATLATYYQSYAERYRAAIPEYFVPESDLWELPLWVAHLSGILAALNWEDTFVDLSRAPASVDPCLDAVLGATRPGDWLLFSPLAQNFGLALEVSRALRQRGRRTAIGGNMAALATEDDATHVIRGIATPETFAAALGAPQALAELPTGRRGTVPWTPRYDLLAGFGKRVPLLRLNASHGCLYACTFCGDSWSRKLYVVERQSLEAEADSFAELFPETRLIYVGDKTFGQSAEAVRNLVDVFSARPGYRFIVQTHVSAVTAALVEAMLRLGVAVVELGFESADEQVLREVRKANGSQRRVREVLRLLNDAGLRVVLNVLGGLPEERPESHAKSISFIEECTDLVWLYNLYNFVPYPLTPLFARLRGRIFDWDYAHWREDSPPVFEPLHLSPQQSWEFFLEKVAYSHRAIGAVAAT